MRAFFLILSATSLLLGACGTVEEQADEENVPMPELILTLADTIGVELGDPNYVFGFAADVVRTDSILYVLDMPFATVKKYLPDGTFAGSFGGNGDGPGEMVFPQFMELLPGGAMLVQDVNDLNIFNLAGEWQGFALEHQQNWPRQHAAADSSSFVVSRHEFIHQPTSFRRGFIALYNLEGNLLQEYCVDSLAIPVAPEDNTDALNRIFFSHYFAADTERNLYLVTRHTPFYRIECFDENGELFNTIEVDSPVVEKTADEIALEKQYIEDYLNGMGTSNVVQWIYEPDTFREPIAGMWLGWQGNLWVLRGTGDRPAFDIWSLPEGNFLYRATLDVELPPGQYFTFYITPHSRNFAVVHEDEGMVQKVLLVDVEYPAEEG